MIDTIRWWRFEGEINQADRKPIICFELGFKGVLVEDDHRPIQVARDQSLLEQDVFFEDEFIFDLSGEN